MKLSTVFSVFIFSFFIIGCTSKSNVDQTKNQESFEELVNSKKKNDTQQSNVRKVVSKEVLQANSYTYVNVEENGKTFWIAVPGQDIEVGKTYYFSDGLQQENFKSKDLDRVFETLLMVSDIRDTPKLTSVSPGASARKESTIAAPSAEDHANFTEGIALSEIFANPSEYDGKTISVHGRCIKVNNQIMGKNWVHLHDGSTEASKDLTITTQDEVLVGTTVIMEGKIMLNKDFGAGYKYDIIMEEAHVK